MRLLLRLVAILTALNFAGSSALAAMPLVWCIGKDGHRAVEIVLHHHALQATDPFSNGGVANEADKDPCSDWRLMDTSGVPHLKNLEAAPKVNAVILAYPPLKLVVAAPFSPNGRRHIAVRQSDPGCQLSVLRSVVLLI